MCAYCIENFAVSPVDAARISQYTAMSVVFNRIPEYYRSICDAIPYEPFMGSADVRNSMILNAFWQAGRIQGIREERQRRRNGRKPHAPKMVQGQGGVKND